MFSISALLVFGALTFVCVKYAHLPVYQAVIAALFGFFLADTGLAPVIGNLVRSLAEAIGAAG